ncbi:MAG: sulfotransferase domain-containing protein [Opitutaceae bacterium]|nr:sulfotransferase domain-containing protein [Opitutaceae bacterium]
MAEVLPPNTFYVVSYPRSGNTWLINCLVMQLDGVRGEDFPYQLNTEAHGSPESGFQFWCEPRRRPDQPICLKSHDAIPLFRQRHPPAPIVYIARDPRDSLLSYYFFQQAYPSLTKEEISTTQIHGTQVILSRGSHDPVFRPDEFADFLRRETPAWVQHVTTAHTDRDLAFLTYEELTRDFAGTLRRATDHVRIPVIRTSEEVAKVYHTGFGAVFSGNNRDFFRRGQIGDWKNWYDPAHARIVAELAGRTLFDLAFETDPGWADRHQGPAARPSP